VAELTLAPLRARPLPSRAINPETLLLTLLAGYISAFALAPLLRLFVEALLAGPNGEPLGVLLSQWRSPATRRALWNTIEASLLSLIVSVVLGGTMALVLRSTDVRAKAALTFSLLLPLLVPPQIIALAWIELIGPSSPILAPLGLAPEPGTTNPLYSKWGIVLIMGIEHSTLVFLAVRAGLQAVPRDLVESARLAGAAPFRVVRSVMMPLVMPSLLGGAAMSFVSSVGNFGTPAVLGIPAGYPVLTTLIYQRLQGFGPRVLGQVAALALILAALAVAGLAARAFFAARARGTIERSSAPFEGFVLGRWRVPVEFASWGVVAVVAIMPLLALVAGSLSSALGVALNPGTATLDNYRFVLANDATHRAFLNSFFLALTAALASIAVAVPLAYFVAVQRRPVARGLDLVADLPYAIPGTALGIGVILLFLRPLPIVDASIYGTIWLLLAAYFARFLALGLRPTMAGMELVNRALDEAGQVAGAGVVRRLRSIMLPLVAPSATAGALLIFMTAFNELTVSALLWSTGNETVGVTIFLLHYEGNSPAAAALATLSVGLILGLALLMSGLGRHLPQGVVPWRA